MRELLPRVARVPEEIFFQRSKRMERRSISTCILEKKPLVRLWYATRDRLQISINKPKVCIYNDCVLLRHGEQLDNSCAATVAKCIKRTSIHP